MDNQILNKIDRQHLPRHIAIVMDGNGRWAQNKHLPRTAGHKKGVDAVEEVLEAASILGIQAVTLYAFSTENWKRPKEEVSYIFKLPKILYNRLIKKLMEWNVRIQWIGEHQQLPNSMKEIIADFEEKTKHNTGLVMYLAFNYGGKAEIISATRAIAQAVKDNKLAIADIDEKLYEQYLYTSKHPHVDLFIRTSGELRISNFLLWQIAYSEFFFTPKLWPDFKKHDLYEAVYQYQQRDRRQGGITK